MVAITALDMANYYHVDKAAKIFCVKYLESIIFTQTHHRVYNTFRPLVALLTAAFGFINKLLCVCIKLFIHAYILLDLVDNKP